MITPRAVPGRNFAIRNPSDAPPCCRRPSVRCTGLLGTSFRIYLQW